MVDHSGRQLDNYFLLRLLGQGNYGQVYLGEHTQRKHLVAVKVLHTGLNYEALRHLVNEARLFRLRHPHIVAVQDFGLEQALGVPFIVMDYAPNGTLRQRHPQGTRVPLELVLHYVQQLADALQYAHDENVIHRDLKPENMLLDQEDRLLLTDFGISVIVQTPPGQTPLEQQNAGIAGTPHYMAPEQFMGRTSRASDQYALAVIVYEWLCGDPPFDGTFYELYAQHSQASPPSLLERVPELSPEIEYVIMRALAKDPKGRFASVREFAQELERAARSLLVLNYVPRIQPRSRQECFDDGVAFYFQGRYKEAAEAFSEAISQDPTYADAYVNRGSCYLQLQEPEKALTDFDRALELNPQQAIAYNGRGYARCALGDDRRALADFERALELDPAYLEAYFNRGRAYRRLQEYEKAISDYSRVLQLDPSHVDAYNNRGNAYCCLGNFEQAIADFSQAIRLNPEYTLAYNNRGNAYDALGEHELALSDLTRAIELDAFYANAYNNRGTVYRNMQEYEQALEDYERALEIQPDYALVYYNRGLTRYEMQDYEQAIQDFERALELDPGYVEAHIRRGMAYDALQEYEKAIADFNRAVELSPCLARTYVYRGLAYAGLGNYRRAILDYDRALELRPDDAESYRHRGVAYFRLGDYQRAILDYDRALQLDPSNRLVRASREEALYRLRQERRREAR
ncbi:serine/threonine-protein kinase [Thermogemmatispora onikobensis]|uniref:serine/threonine-protein kinase n=2 Tax=Thermogemmatispora TaxID=768669 RepID=UPI000852B208|nr:serine/threonine-protein kinase [Thermogemmatispora onikobensis]